MAEFYKKGERKKLSGIYQRYTNIGGVDLAGAIDGVVAIPIKSNWGELNKIHTINFHDEIDEYFGTGGTTQLLHDLLNEGVDTIYAVRLGDMGTRGTVQLKDDAGVEAVNLTLKYEGDRAFTFLLREVLEDDTKKEFVLLEGSLIDEVIQFSIEGNAIDNLIAAIQENSKFIVPKKVEGYVGDGSLNNVQQAEFSRGTNPDIVMAHYNKAFELFEQVFFNLIAVDTCDLGVHALQHAFVNQIYQYDHGCFAFVSEGTDVDFDTRCKHAKAYNDYNVIYFGHGWKDMQGNVYDGQSAIGRVAGKIAATPSDQSITRDSISQAVEIIEPLKRSEKIKAVDSGMITLTYNKQGLVVYQEGITTLVSPEGEDDEGWKKIKRCKVRFELFQRMDDTLDKYVAQLNNNPNDRSLVVQTGNAILTAMAVEEKVAAGAYMAVSVTNKPKGDSAWFEVFADDVDTLEKLYLNYNFRFSPNI